MMQVERLKNPAEWQKKIESKMQAFPTNLKIGPPSGNIQGDWWRVHQDNATLAFGGLIPVNDNPLTGSSPEIILVVCKQHQRVGAGKILLREILSYASSEPTIDQVSAQVMASNTMGESIIEWLLGQEGFRDVGMSFHNLEKTLAQHLSNQPVVLTRDTS